MIGIRFTSIGVLVALILLSIAVSPVHARMGGGGGGNSGAILDQINDIVAKYNGNHTGLMQAFSGEFGNTLYIIVKKSFWSRSQYVYKGQIDPLGYITVSEVARPRRGGGGEYDCDNNICITTTKGDVNTAYDYLMANSKDYIMLDDVYELSTKLLDTWTLSAELFDEIISWILDEYL